MTYGSLAADQISTSVTGVSLGPGNATNFKNRIINGGMVIDQRNSGASLTVNSTAQKYAVDRFYCENGTDGVFTIQQSSSAPAGFTNSVVATVTTTDTSIGASQYAAIAHQIEGYNVSDMNFGTVNAKTFTLSFWVQSSVTGTFGGTFRNSADSRCYPFTYTINVANTWEQKSITVAGDTTGTWLATTGIGLKVWFSFAAGSTISGTANAWASTTYLSATGATNFLNTNGSTWYLTGVQLEVGSVASGFEVRDYGRELSMCQRYFYQNTEAGSGVSSGGTTQYAYVKFPQIMRATPTIAWISGGRIGTGTSDTAITGVGSSIGGSTSDTIIGMTTTTFGTAGQGLVMYQSPIMSFSSEL